MSVNLRTNNNANTLTSLAVSVNIRITPKSSKTSPSMVDMKKKKKLAVIHEYIT